VKLSAQQHKLTSPHKLRQLQRKHENTYRHIDPHKGTEGKERGTKGEEGSRPKLKG
jgi:hypothetical protein